MSRFAQWKMFFSLVALLSMGCASHREINQKNAILHMQIGMSLLSVGRNPEALKELLEAESLDGNNSKIQQYLAMAYAVRDRFELAEKHYTKALRLDSRDTEIRYNYAKLLIHMRRWNEAAQQLQLAQEDLTYQRPEEVLSLLGWLYFQKQEYQKAQGYLKQSLAIKKDVCGPTNLLGRSEFELKQYETAAETFDRSVKLCRDSSYDEPLFYSGFSYFKMGQRNKAMSRLEELTNKFQNSDYSPRAKVMLEMLK